MAQVLLLDESWLKENSSITANVDPLAIFPFVRTAQDIYIQEAVGTSLYKYLLGIVEVGPPYSTQDEELLVIVRQALLWYTVYDFLPSNWIVIRNLGLLKQSSDNAVSIEQSDLDYLRNDCQTKATFYINRLIAYLCTNGSKYSEYNNGCWSCGDIAPASKPKVSVDLFFDDNYETRETELLRKAGIIR